MLHRYCFLIILAAAAIAVQPSATGEPPREIEISAKAIERLPLWAEFAVNNTFDRELISRSESSIATAQLESPEAYGDYQSATSVSLGDSFLGDSFLGEPLGGRIRLNNTSDAAIRIASVRGGCTCTAIQTKERLIAPGGHQDVIVEITRDSIEAFRVPISIDIGNKQHLLLCSGRIVSALQIVGGAAEVDGDLRASVDLQIDDPRWADIPIKIQPGHAGFRIESTLHDDHRLKLQIQLAQTANLPDTLVLRPRASRDAKQRAADLAPLDSILLPLRYRGVTRVVSGRIFADLNTKCLRLFPTGTISCTKCSSLYVPPQI